MTFTEEILIFCVLVKICRSLYGKKNVKFVLNDVKATAFSGSKRRDIRASILVPLASQSNVTRNAHNDVLLHPGLKTSYRRVMYAWCSSLYIVIRQRALRARLGSRLDSARRELISSTRVTGALNAGMSMNSTWAFQFYETLV